MHFYMSICVNVYMQLCVHAYTWIDTYIYAVYIYTFNKYVCVICTHTHVTITSEKWGYELQAIKEAYMEGIREKKEERNCIIAL